MREVNDLRNALADAERSPPTSTIGGELECAAVAALDAAMRVPSVKLPRDEAQYILKHGTALFNRKARRGLQYLCEHDAFGSGPDQLVRVAAYLRAAEGLNRAEIGEFLAGSGPFSLAVADAFFAPVMEAWTRERPQLDEALRMFFSGWR